MFLESFFKQFTQGDYSSTGPPCATMRINRTEHDLLRAHTLPKDQGAKNLITHVLLKTKKKEKKPWLARYSALLLHCRAVH